MARLAYLFHPDYHLHVQGPGHLERPARTEALAEYLPTTDLWPQLRMIEPHIEPTQTLELVHSTAYIDLVASTCEHGGGLVDGRETGVIRESFRIARRAVGAVTGAIDAVLAGEVDHAFCAVRPPGHHALSDQAMGFCLFNNVAIGARYAQQRHGIERVLIADWDFHHGNGTQAIFWSDPTVLFFSVHCYGVHGFRVVYPGSGRRDETGEGPGEGFTINAPLPPGAGRREYLEVFDDMLAPAVERFRPELVLISAGFDAHRDDPLSAMYLDADDYRTLTERVVHLAERFAEGRVVSVLEGGYNAQALALSVEQHLRGLVG